MKSDPAKPVINLIQDIATPHNNVLIQEFIGRTEVEVRLWYSLGSDQKRYQWGNDLTHAHVQASVYGRGLNIDFISYCLAHKGERYVIVGWANTNTRLLHLIFFMLRRPFNHWTDLPDPNQEGMSVMHKLMRWACYRLLRYSNCKIFGVGKTTMECLRSWGFPQERLVNLPIFVSVDDNILAYKSRRNELLQHYAVPESGYLLSAGSRLVFEKGYDLLIQGIAELNPELLSKVRLVIVGSGEETIALNHQINELGLQGAIQLMNWLDISDFKALIANSEIFIHPARFDSYGGTTLGMALGVPVIGSTGAGAAVDRIEHGVNGFLYEPTDTKALAGYITRLIQDAELRKRIGDAGRRTALQWPPSRGVDILAQYSI